MFKQVGNCSDEFCNVSYHTSLLREVENKGGILPLNVDKGLVPPEAVHKVHNHPIEQDHSFSTTLRLWQRERERGKERGKREREREREREGERQTDRQKERKKCRERERERQIDKEKQMQRKRGKRKRERKRESENCN